MVSIHPAPAEPGAPPLCLLTAYPLGSERRMIQPEPPMQSIQFYDTDRFTES